MMDYFTRTAALDDLPVLLEFEQQIIRAERPYDPTLDKDPINYYDIAEMIRSGQTEVVVVEYQRTIVASGYATIKKAKPHLNHMLFAYLGFMYTHPEHRGKGVNKMIVGALKNWANSQGINEIRLTVYDDNLRAIKAYEKAGFKKHLIEMRLH